MATAKAAIVILSPGIHTALSEKALVQSLPVEAINHSNPISDSEGGACDVVPVARIKADVGLVEGFTSATQREEAFRVQVGKYEDEDIDGEVSEAGGHCCRYVLDLATVDGVEVGPTSVE
jgi:hypothetical protein